MKLIRIYGVDLRIHVLLFFLLGILFFFGYVEDTLISLIVVLLHEGAHMMIAKLLGYKVENIELFPFGGVARIKEDISMNPQHEIIIAAAGPICNFILAFLAYNLFHPINLPDKLIIIFVYANLSIGIFNLIPILPLDGGRIIRAYLAFIIGVKKSTKVIVNVSKALSIVLFMWGCLIIQYNKLNIFILFLALFLFIAAKREEQMAGYIFMKEINNKKQYLLDKGVLNTKYLVAIKDSSAKDIMNQFVPRKYHIITVMDKKCNIIGLLTESEMIEGVLKYGMNVTIEKLLRNR